MLFKELRFLQLTVYILFFLFTFPFFGHEWIFKLFSSIFLLNALLVSLSAGGRHVRLKWLLWMVFGIVVSFTVLYLMPPLPEQRHLFLLAAIIFEIFLLILCLWVILSFILENRRVTLDTIFAAVVAYFIIAIIFAQVYFFLLNTAPQSFNLPAVATPSTYHVLHGDLVYYSLIVITTAGIGDIVPLNPVARVLTAIEAMLGQFFVAIFVAWLVGRFISQAQSKPPDQDQRL